MKKHLNSVLAMMMAGGVMLTAGSVQAVDVNLTVKGVITIPPCNVNNSGTIEVDFGNIPVTALTNGNNAGYLKQQSVPVTCDYYQGTPYVRVTGTQLSGAGTNVLATSTSRFGIALYQGSGTSVAMTLGNGTTGVNGENLGYRVQSGALSGVNQASGQFTFTAVPYQSGSTQLTAGEFTATANMSISYQ